MTEFACTRQMQLESTFSCVLNGCAIVSAFNVMAVSLHYRHRLRHWVTRSRKLALTVVKSRVYFFLILLLLLVNLILLMSLHYPYNRTLDRAVCK